MAKAPGHKGNGEEDADKTEASVGANLPPVWWQKLDTVWQGIKLPLVGMDESWRQTYAERKCPTVHEMELTRNLVTNGLTGKNDIALV